MKTQQHAGENQTGEGLIVWACPLPSCERVIVFKDEEASTRAFLIVHHLAHRHGWTRSEVLNHKSNLKDAAEEYRGFPTDGHGRLI